MTFLFYPEAEEGFIAAIDYYENRETGPGCDFSIEVFTALQSIVGYPYAWQGIEEDIRRCLVKSFFL